MIADGVRLIHENRHAHTLSFGPGKPPHPGGQSGSGRAYPGRSGRDLRSSPTNGRALGQGSSTWGPSVAQGEEAGTSEGRHAASLAGGPGRPCDHGSDPGPVETSVLSVDAGSRGAPDRGSVRHPAVGLAGGALSGAVGVYPAEAGASLPLSGTRSGCAGGRTGRTRRSGRGQSGREPRFTGETRWGCVPTMWRDGLTGAGGRRRSSRGRGNGSSAT